MDILELRAARGWSLSQSADRFLATAATIASYVRCIDEEGPESLIQICQPVNKFPDFVRYVVQRLKVLCSWLGSVRIAHILSRAGLYLAKALMVHSPPSEFHEWISHELQMRKPVGLQ